MSGGGPSNSTSTTISQPWGPAAKYGRLYMPALWNYLTGTGTQPSIMNDPFPNQQVAGFTPDQMAAFGQTDQASANLAGLMSGADAQANATIGGQYLNPSSNPYLQSTYNSAAQGVTNSYMYGTAPSTAAKFAAAGGYGDSAYNDANAQNAFGFGNNLAALGANIYGTNYANERQNQLNTLNNVGSLAQSNYIPAEALRGSGQIQQGQAQNVNNANYQNAYNQAQFPFQALQMLGNGISGMGSMGGSSISMAPFMGAGKGM